MKDHAAGSILIASPLLRSLQLSNVPGLTYEAASPNKQVLSAEAMANIAKHSSKLEEFKIVNAQIGAFFLDPFDLSFYAQTFLQRLIWCWRHWLALFHATH